MWPLVRLLLTLLHRLGCKVRCLSGEREREREKDAYRSYGNCMASISIFLHSLQAFSRGGGCVVWLDQAEITVTDGSGMAGQARPGRAR